MTGLVLFAALALMLILEGILPFLAPQMWRNAFRKIVDMQDGQIRFFGLTSMIAGIALLILPR